MVNFAKITEFSLDADLAYLTGVIIGDGNISNYHRTLPPTDEIDPRIFIETGDRTFLNEKVKPIIEKIHSRRKCKIFERKARKETRNSTWVISFRSKYFHRFLTEELGLPKGKKAEAVSISKIIDKTKGSTELRKQLIAGIFDTDGGLRGQSIGQCTASKKLRDDLVELLKEQGIHARAYEWTNKKYNKKYYEWKIKKHATIKEFLDKIPLRNTNRLNKIMDRFPAIQKQGAGGEI